MSFKDRAKGFKQDVLSDSATASSSLKQGHNPSRSTLIDVLEDAASQKSYLGMTFVEDKNRESLVSYADIADMAKAIAVQLTSKHNISVGDRAFVVCPPGVHFVAAYFGCLYCGAIAVPIMPPYDQLSSDKFQRIIEDARPSIFLTTKSYM